MMKVVVSICVISFLCVRTHGSKILGVFPALGYSQYILGEALMKELANRGHDVTVISPYNPESAIDNYKSIKVSKTLANSKDTDFLELENVFIFTSMLFLYDFGFAITENVLKNDEVQKLLVSDEQFDLVIVEEFVSDALKGFAGHFKCPLVLLSSMGLTEWNKHPLGLPALPSISTISHASYTNQMKFFQRLKVFMYTIFHYCYRSLVVNPGQRHIMNKYFPSKMEFDEVVNNASLMLMNSYVTTSENVLLPYNAIEIGGFFIQKSTLAKDIQEILNTAKNGAILFSMGTNAKSTDFTNSTLNAILNAFERLDQKVLWKFESDLPNKPSNVYIYKWLKQADVLAHPNLKLFITHGGLLSTTEAIHFGVPIIGIPIFGDQKMNIARAVANGIAKKIPLRELSEENFYSTIQETLNNKEIRENVQRLSNFSKDRIVPPLDLAVHWIEHTIRHKGFHFKGAFADLSWLKFYSLEILFFGLFQLFILLWLVRSIYLYVSIYLKYSSRQKKGLKRKNKLQ